MLQIVKGIQNPKHHPRNLIFLKQLKKTDEMVPRGGYGRRTFLMDSHPYSYETFTLGAPHEEVQGRQTKLHEGFTLGILVPSPGISILRDSHIVLSKRS